MTGISTRLTEMTMVKKKGRVFEESRVSGLEEKEKLGYSIGVSFEREADVGVHLMHFKFQVPHIIYTRCNTTRLRNSQLWYHAHSIRWHPIVIYLFEVPSC